MGGEHNNICIYLVEDQALVREGLQAMLGSEASLIVAGQAGTAEQALLDLQRLDVDVVLMDVGLPGMGGIEAVRRLKEQRPSLPVVMLTSSEGARVLEALEAGAIGYILKTTSLQQLVQAIRSAHQGQRPIDPAVTGALVSSLAELRHVHRQSLLSPRQVEILRLVADGTTYSDVAARLFISVATVNREMRTIFDRFGVNDAVHAVSAAYKQGLLT